MTKRAEHRALSSVRRDFVKMIDTHSRFQPTIIVPPQGNCVNEGARANRSAGEQKAKEGVSDEILRLQDIRKCSMKYAVLALIFSVVFPRPPG